MPADRYLKYLQEEIHTVVAATIDDSGLPVTCAIDMMEADENSLYFLTAKGKGFYDRLKKKGYVALTGIKGRNTMSCVAISLRGMVTELGNTLLPRLFEKNPYMWEIYPTQESQKALTVFQIYEGVGEWFDLSQQPIERTSFSFGGAQAKETGYFVTDKCIGCKLCYSKCPQKCIDISTKPVVIRQEHCLHCGNCYEICPARAVERRVRTVTQDERLDFLLRSLLAEREEYADISIPDARFGKAASSPRSDECTPAGSGQRGFFEQCRTLICRERLVKRGITRPGDLTPVRTGLYIWQGDITTLAADAIVNAANSGLLGCFVPCHGCIDNAIHTYAGVQLRMECARLIAGQNGEEPTGTAKITKAYNLPCRYVLHTVGPIIDGSVTNADRELLASCYRACLDLADAKGLRTVAFCCISTGEFGFPNEPAAQIAVSTVCAHDAVREKRIEVIFNVFKEQDEIVYRRLLAAD